MRVETEVSVRFLVTSFLEHLHTQANFSLLSVCNRRSVRLLFWRVGKHLAIIRPLEYYLDLLGVMSFLLVPLLPRLVAWDRHYVNLYIDKHYLVACFECWLYKVISVY